MERMDYLISTLRSGDINFLTPLSLQYLCVHEDHQRDSLGDYDGEELLSACPHMPCDFIIGLSIQLRYLGPFSSRNRILYQVPVKVRNPPVDHAGVLPLNIDFHGVHGIC